MQASAISLARLQRRFAGLVTAPEGVEAALPACGDAEARELERWLRPDQGVSALERLEVYAHAFFARIHAALGEDFPALRAALGEAAFHDLAKLYLLAHPPRTFSLRFVGAELPGFLRGEAAAFFRERCAFAADLAALEWAIDDVFDAPDAPALVRAELAAVAPETWGALRFELAPAHRLLELAFPAQRVREAHDAGRELPPLAPEPTAVLVLRRAERVFYRAVPRLEAAALALVRAGSAFEKVCLQIASTSDAITAAPRAVALLERWLADGLLCAVRSRA